MEAFSEHFRKEHFLTTTDARVKLIVVLVLLVMVLSYKGILFPLLIAAASFFICLRMRIPLRVMFLRFSQPMFIALVVLLLKFFFSGKETLFSINFLGLAITGHTDGLIEGTRITSRIIGGVSLVVMLGFATPFIEFVAALSWLRVPKAFIEIMTFAYRYLFVFLEDGLTIYQAQKNRLGYSGIRKGLKSFGTLTGSLVLRSFEQSQKTSEAMMQRGYTGDLPILKGKPLRAVEVALAVVFIFFAGSIWWIQ
jgi:cobalt/nickel transport system permease protein